MATGAVEIFSQEVVKMLSVCVYWVGWGGVQMERKHAHTCGTHTLTQRETPKLFTSVHHDRVGLCSQCELIIGGFPLVEVLIEPLLTIIKRLSMDNVHEASE